MSVHAINFEMPWLAARRQSASPARQPAQAVTIELEPAPATLAAVAPPRDCAGLLDAVLEATPAAVVATSSTSAVAATIRQPPAPPPAPRQAARRSRQSEIISGRRQKLATRQITPGRYAFDYQGAACEVAKAADGWRLTIDGTAGSRRYETKRHAVNAARVYLDSRRDTFGPQAAPAPAPQVAAPASEQELADDGRPVDWRDPAAPWRRAPATRRQYGLIRHLRDKLAACGKSASDPGRLTRGQASTLIDAMKAELGTAAKSARPGVACCSLGPFAGGYCCVCGLKEARR